MGGFPRDALPTFQSKRGQLHVQPLYFVVLDAAAQAWQKRFVELRVHVGLCDVAPSGGSQRPNVENSKGVMFRLGKTYG